MTPFMHFTGLVGVAIVFALAITIWADAEISLMSPGTQPALSPAEHLKQAAQHIALAGAESPPAPVDPLDAAVATIRTAGADWQTKAAAKAATATALTAAQAADATATTDLAAAKATLDGAIAGLTAAAKLVYPD